MTIDFHVHTHNSYDSIMKPEKIIRIAKSRGLNGIVICDHNTIKGGIELSKINKDKNFHIIVGAEIATDAGDITGIFLTKEINSRRVDEVIDEIKKQGGKVILNHPYKGHDLSKIDFTKIDFIEGYNSRLNLSDNQRAVLLAKKYKIPIIAGSDAHLYSEIGNCKTEMNNIKDFVPVNCHYKPSKQGYITISQYIKAFKRRSFSVFFSASIIYFKSILGIKKPILKTTSKG